MVISIYATAPSVAAKFIDDGYTKYTNKEKKRKTKHRTAQYIGDLHYKNQLSRNPKAKTVKV